WGTIAVNVSGSFLIGLIAALESADGRSLLSPGIRLFFLIGLLGGFTTFSAFSLQTLTLLQHEQYGRALANATGSVLLCVFAAWAGHVAGGAFNR
ncbi:MAG: CrcB family protein, partial [Alphaproteobacteria bacterium]